MGSNNFESRSAVLVKTLTWPSHAASPDLAAISQLRGASRVLSCLLAANTIYEDERAAAGRRRP